MFNDNTFVVEISGIMGAAFPPGFLRLVAERLHNDWFVKSESNLRRLWARHYVDNTLLDENSPDKRARANDLILRGGADLTDSELDELIEISREADKLILDDAQRFKEPVDVVLRRGGVLQSCIHIKDPRWQRMRPLRDLEPKLMLLLRADLPVIRDAYQFDVEFQKLRTRDREAYCSTPERAYELQSDWLEAVRRLPGVFLPNRRVFDSESLVSDTVELIMKEAPNNGLQTLRRTSCFLSYSAKDQGFCDRLYEDLKTNGVRTSYFREHAYEAGQPLWQQIERAIESCASVVLVASRDSLRSEAVLRELQYTTRIESQRKRRALRVATIDDFVFSDWQHEQAERVRNDIVADFRGFELDTLAYDRGLRKLLTGLRTV